MRRWHGDGLVFLGDAAHAMSPQLGQGVNLALADASCLAHHLALNPLPQGLKCYQRDRRFALGYYALATRWLTPWFQSDHTWLSPLRRMFFRSLQPIGPARRLMTLSMAGMIGDWKPKAQ
jgi:2-polyprenyl-6-methoxyphenol hydroxylase-like FAD-dependent oxidoreductase